MVRKKIILAVTAIAVIGTGIFNGCKKDPVEITNDSKNHAMLKSMTDDGLWEFEIYTPEESFVEEKLSLINECVNNPEGNPLPNMELKEAVWFLETYFNLGVCNKQKHAVQYVNSRKTYLMPVSLAEESSEDGIFLDGLQLQIMYNEILNTIVTEVCSEYAINFGDIYVHSISSNAVTLGLGILYGPQEVEAAHPYRFKQIVDLNTNMIYPADPAEIRQYEYHEIPVRDLYYEEGIRDEFMEYVLNQKRSRFMPTGVRDLHGPCKVPSYQDYMNTLQFPYDITSFPLNSDEYTYLTPYLSEDDYVSFGEKYRDYIYNVILPVQRKCKVIHGMGGEQPLWGRCDWVINRISGSENSIVMHEFWIEKACQGFVDPDTYCVAVHYALIP
jgi:hypothetical protein